MVTEDLSERIKTAAKKWAVVAASLLVTALAAVPVSAGEGVESYNAAGTLNRSVSVDPIGRSEGFSTMLYNNMNGLPTSEANAVAETGEGFIWIGSYGGLVRYDGNTFTRMDSTTGLSSVKCLYVDSQDRLWIGTNDNGVAVMERGKLRRWTKLEGMSSSHIRSITEDQDGIIYVATTHGITKIDAQGKLAVMEEEELAEANMRHLRIGNDGIIYGTTDGGDMLRIKDGKLLSFLGKDDNPACGAGSILPDPEAPGMVYFEGADFGFYHATLGDTLTDMEPMDIQPLSYVQQLEYIDGTVWVCAANGIGVLRDGEFTLLDNLPLNSNVGHVMTDYLGNLWFTSSRQGVMKVVPNQFANIFERYGLTDTVVNTTCMNGDQLFVGTDQGLIVLDAEGQVSELPLREAKTASGVDMEAKDLIALMDGVRIRSIIRDSKDRLWISTWRKYGLLRFDHGVLTAFTEAEGLLSNSLRAICEDGQGRIIVALTGGANIIEGNRVVKGYGSEDGIFDTESLCIEVGPKGEIILGSNGGGIYIINGDGVTNVNVEEGLPSDIVMRLKRDEERNLTWIVTSNALAYMDADYRVTTIQKFPYTNNFDLYEDKDGKMWVLSSNGLYVVPTEELLANGDIHPVFYGPANGLSCITTANSYSELTADGDLYISGGTGVCLVNIDEPFEDVANLKVAVPYVEADGERLYPDENGVFKIPAAAKRVSIPSFVFNYSLSDPQVSRQLEGFETEATTVNRSKMSALNYTNLRGGTYHFVMELKDSLGRGSKVITVEIFKEKHYYEQLWFILLAIGFFILLVDLMARIHMRRKMQILEARNQETMRQNKLLQDSEAKLREQMEIISSLANIYNSMYELDLENDRYKELRGEGDLPGETGSGSSEEAGHSCAEVSAKAETDGTSTEAPAKEERLHVQELVNERIKKAMDPSCIDEELLADADLNTIDERLSHQDVWTKEYMDTEKQWRRGRFIVSKRAPGGKITRLLWVSEDINKERMERERLRNESERAMAASEAKSSFLSNMSHEIRTPINAVLGMNEMIQRESENENILMYSDNIRTAGNTLLGLINDILDFSKIEAGKMEILPVDYDLSILISDLINLIRNRMDSKGLLLKLDFDETLPRRLHGDEVRIKQVVTNLLTNAVKYTEKGSVTFTIGYERAQDAEEDIFLTVSVKDTGIGIKPEHMAKLFTAFERIEEKRNRNVEGTGLGMNITQRLLEMMGSRLEVESVYGEGSVFSFRLRQRVASWEALGDYQAAYRASLIGRKRYQEQFVAPDARVLVVDDTPMNLVVFGSLLKRTCVGIETASSGDECLTKARDTRFDIIFLDYMMPDKDGIQTLHELRSDGESANQKTPVICLTANAIAGVREECLGAGFDDYLTKPIDANALEKMIMAYLPEDKLHKPGTAAKEPSAPMPAEKPLVLIADDDPSICTMAARLLGQDFRVETCHSGAETPVRVRTLKPDLILLDINLGDMSGFDVLHALRETPGTDTIPVVFLTGAIDEAAEIEGFKAGAADYVRKPFVPEVLIRRIKRIITLDHLQRGLESEVKRQTLRAEHLTQEMMLALSKTVDAKDHYTNGHSQRVAAYAAEIARRMGKSPLEQQYIYEMGLLHDVGKIGVPEEIINKKSRLTDEEFDTIKKHTVIGSDILSLITEMPELAQGARSHHERYNGTGYPDGLKGNEIPEPARIICIADCYDAMTSTRTYSTPKPQEKVRSEFERWAGIQFDPDIARVMIEMIDEDKEYVMNERTADIRIWRGSDKLWSFTDRSTGRDIKQADASAGSGGASGDGPRAGTLAEGGAGNSGTGQAMAVSLPAWLYSVDELDTAQGLQRFGDAKTYLDMLKIYAESVPASADEIEGLWEKRDLVNTTVKVHAVKSLSRTIGADAIGALAEKLELAGKEGNAQALEAELGDLLARIRALGSTLASLNG